MVLTFSHRTAAQRVHFGAGRAARHLADEVERIGASRIMVVAGGRSRATAQEITRGLPVVVEWDEVVTHVTIDVAERARETAKRAEIDLMISVGGGSAVGTAKAVAMTEDIPIVAVPTTYAGSEGTDVWGLTQDGRKTTGVDDAVLPVAVVYDVTLTLGLDVETSIASGLNGIAHCVDGFWAPRADPINAALGSEATRAIAKGITVIVRDPSDRDGRESAQLGAYLAAVAFASAGSGLHHKICHALGGTFGLPHAQTHAVVLPHVAAFNLPFAPNAQDRLRQALDSDDALDGLERLYRTVDAPRSLASLGFTQRDITEAVDVILPTVPASNPRPVDAASLSLLLTAAWRGRAPGA